MALASDPDNLDPAVTQTIVGWEVLLPMCEGLYAFDANMEIQPQLATAAPAYSDGGKTVSVALRDGVVFNDGTPFNSSAVKQSLDLASKITGSALQPTFDNIASIDTPTPTSIVFHMKQTYAPFASDLAGSAAMIASPAQRQKLGDKFGTAPVCVGPFMFDNRASGTSITMKKSDLYYDKAQVALDAIDFKVISDSNAREINIRSGDVDIAERIPLTDVASLSTTDGIKITTQVGLGWSGLSINLANTNGVGKPPVPRDSPLAQSAELRQALELSLDKSALSKLTSGGLSMPSCSLLSPSSPYFDNPQCPAFDLSKAKQLVADSGFPTPVKITLSSLGDPVNTRLVQAIQGMAGKAGFQITPATYDLSTLLKKWTTGDFDTLLMVWGGLPDPDANISPFYSSDGYFNTSGIKDSEIDAILIKARGTLDPATRKTLYAQALDKTRALTSIVILSNPAVALAARSNVVGYTYTPGGEMNISRAGFTS